MNKATEDTSYILNIWKLPGNSKKEVSATICFLRHQTLIISMSLLHDAKTVLYSYHILRAI